MKTHILSNLPEAYDNIIENLEDELDNDNYHLAIKRISDKLLDKYDQMNMQPVMKNSREDEESV